MDLIYKSTPFSQSILNSQINEIEIDQYYGNNLSNRVSGIHNKIPKFYGSPKYSPEINLIPGVHNSFRPMGSLSGNIKADSSVNYVSQNLPSLRMSRVAVSLDEVELPPRRQQEIIELDDSPRETKNRLAVAEPLEEEKVVDIKNTRTKRNPKKIPSPYPHKKCISESFSDSDDDFQEYLENLTKKERNMPKPKHTYDDVDSHKDYELFEDDESNLQGTGNENIRECKSQEVTEKHTDNSLVPSRKRSNYRMLNSEEKFKAVEMAKKIGTKAASTA